MIAEKSIFAIVGKGGTGKTTISGILLKYLTEVLNSTVLAVDADPSSCLGDLLGICVEETIGDVREDALDKPATIPQGMSKQQYFDLQIQSQIVESGKIDLLTMGRPEGPGCYCYVNSILRNCIDKLSGKYKYVVMDCEAGLEHLSRRTAVNIDYLFVVSDVSVKGVKTACIILDVIKELKTTAHKKILIFNRVGGETEEKIIEGLVKNIPLDEFGFTGVLPADKNIFDFEMSRKSILDLPDNTPFFLSFKDIMNKI